MKIFICQTSPYAGDLTDNFNKIITLYEQAISYNAQICVFPELMTTGYFARDLFLKNSFLADLESRLQYFIQQTRGSDIYSILPTPIKENDHLYNGLLVIHAGMVIGKTYKHKLPNRDIFDERRYFIAGTPNIVNIKGFKVGFPICEDIWSPYVCNKLKQDGAKLFIVPNASPFHHKKLNIRQKIIKTRFEETNIPIIYCNQALGQDGIIFDGNSFTYDGKMHNVCHAFTEDYAIITYDNGSKNLIPCKVVNNISETAEIYLAMVLGIRDYIHKNGFKSILLGLSGGIDSALVATLATDALGSENVLAIMMPTEFTSKQSFIDAKEIIDNLGINSETISISDLLNQFSCVMDIDCTEYKIAHQNLQSRIRGTLLMGISNKYNKLLLTTGNKSEYATGYTTLYGDMNGAFNPIKDLYKTDVYKIAKYRNNNIPKSSLIHFQKKNIIPKNIIEKSPSAELSFNQKDSDTLPEYDILDAILELYIEQDLGRDYIIKKGFDLSIVDKVIHLVKKSEFKRWQAAPGVRLSSKNLEDDRRYSITNLYKG